MQESQEAAQLKQNQSPGLMKTRQSILPPIVELKPQIDKSFLFESSSNLDQQSYKQDIEVIEDERKEAPEYVNEQDSKAVLRQQSQSAFSSTSARNQKFARNESMDDKTESNSVSTASPYLMKKQKNSAPSQGIDFQQQRLIHQKKCCCNKCCLQFCFFFKYACMSIKRKKCQFILAFFACFLVVLVTLVANTVLQNGSLIFFSTAQGSVGQKDMVIKSSGIGDSEVQFLNVTRINQLVKTSKATSVSPRMSLNYGIICKNACQFQSKSSNFIFTALNSMQEFQNGLGTRYSLRDQGKIPPGSCQISSNIARRLGINVNDQVELSINMMYLLQVLKSSFEHEFPEQGPLSIESFFMKIKCDVYGQYGQIGGREGDGTHNVVYMQIETLFSHIAQFIITSNQKFKDFVAGQNASQYATQGMINFANPRINLYLNSDYDQLQRQATEVSNQIVSVLGFYPVKMELPILQDLRLLSLGSIFFGIILSLIVVLLSVLSIMLIYSLLMVSIETKTFEIAIIRMLGVSKCEIIGMLLTQAFTFVFPSLIVGYIVSFPILAVITNVFKKRVNYGFQPVPTGLATFYALLLGIGIPILSSLIPIRTALAKSLSESIDYNRSKTQAVIYQIIQGSQSGKVFGILFGFVAVLFGVGIYYFLPLSILSMNLTLLFNIFFAILVGMLVGFILIAINAQHLLEIILLYIFFFWQKKSTLKVVLKNLTAHRLRNQKTSLMYALSVSFSIMIISAYTMQLKATAQQWIKGNGTYLRMKSERINMTSMNQVIDNNIDAIEQYSFATTTPASQASSDVNESILSDQSRLQNMKIWIHGYSSNFFSPMIDGFVNVSERTNSALPLQEQLYTARGSQSFGTGSNALQNTGASPNRRDKYMVFNLQNSNNRVFHLMHPAWSLDSTVVFKMQDRRSNSGSIAVSLPTLRRIAGYKSVKDIPIEYIFLKFKQSATQQDKNRFYDQIDDQYISDKSIKLTKYQDVKSSIQSVQSLLDLIFSIVLIIVMFLCFFSLVASMSANILDQAKEIAVLRALGMTRGRIILIYIYEAFLLVFASSMLGIFIGTLVGWTMVLQRVLFLQLPLEFYFPYWQTLAVFFVAIICAFASSCAPARSLLNKQIAQIVRTHA